MTYKFDGPFVNMSYDPIVGGTSSDPTVDGSSAPPTLSGVSTVSWAFAATATLALTLLL